MRVYRLCDSQGIGPFQRDNFVGESLHPHKSPDYQWLGWPWRQIQHCAGCMGEGWLFAWKSMELCLGFIRLEYATQLVDRGYRIAVIEPSEEWYFDDGQIMYNPRTAKIVEQINIITGEKI